MRNLALLPVFLLLGSGCILIIDGDDDDGDSDGGDVSDGSDWSDDGCDPLPDVLLRDPYTGQCVDTGGGGCGIAVPADSAGAPFMEADWAQCFGFCEQLDEASCHAADACRAVYIESCPECDDLSPPVYFACWGTAPSGPLSGTDCSSFDAQECSRHNDCEAVHDDYRSPDGTEPFGVGDFLWCRNEEGSQPGCYSDEQCPEGYECTADTDCAPPPGCDPANGCDTVCYGKCVPAPPPACGELDESGCIGRQDCRPLYEGSDCSCTPMGCGCQTQTFLTCADGMGPDGPAGECGPYVCSAKEYCQITNGGAPPPDGMDPAVWYSCQPAPEQCIGFGEDGTLRPADCMCLSASNLPCSWECSSDAGGFSTLTCNAP